MKPVEILESSGTEFGTVSNYTPKDRLFWATPLNSFSFPLQSPSSNSSQTLKDRSFLTESEMGYHFKDRIEICSSEQDAPGSYYPGMLLAAIGRSQYLVQYKTCQSESGEPLVRVVGENEIRPEPPEVGNFRVLESDVVDGFVNGGWRIGRIVKKVEPSYHVKVDCDGSVYHLAWFKVRIHLDLVDAKWVCRKIADDGLHNYECGVKPKEVAPEAEDDTVKCPVVKLERLENL